MEAERQPERERTKRTKSSSSEIRDSENNIQINHHDTTVQLDNTPEKNSDQAKKNKKKDKKEKPPKSPKEPISPSTRPDSHHFEAIEDDKKERAQERAEYLKSEKERQKQRIKEEKQQQKEEKEKRKANKNNLKNKSGSRPGVRGVSTIRCTIKLLDLSSHEIQIDKRSSGGLLFDKVCEHLHLQEPDYFGLVYHEIDGIKYWLEPDKKVTKQLKAAVSDWTFRFCVKFYPLYPTQVQDEVTRYQLCLQIRQDINAKRVPVTLVSESLLGSYTAQSELGDYDAAEHGSGHHYLEQMTFSPDQNYELLEKIAELHKKHVGLTPEQAEYNYLEAARKLELYGVEFHEAEDADHIKINLGVSARGLLIYKNRRLLNRFAWPQITKLSYNFRIFTITLRPVAFEPYQRVIGFNLESGQSAKRLWWICSEHHVFFRLKEPEQLQERGLFGLGSKFRYSGRTQHQLKTSLSMRSLNASFSVAS